jgi:hypothetical protein
MPTTRYVDRQNFSLQRLVFAWAILIAGDVLAAPPAPPAQAETTTAVSVRAERRQAADRQRRIIFNNDGNEPVSAIKRPSRDDLLAARTTELAGTQVDSIFYCTTYGSFGVFHHHTKVGTLFTTTEGRYASNQVQALYDAGIDPLTVMIEFCKEHEIELFWSLRMNDTHDGSRADYGPIMLSSNPLKREHPEYLLGTPTKRPKHGSWTAVNYGRPEIRDLAFRYIEEVATNYDVDGVELDFFRHPVFFKSTAQGQPVSADERNAMTELLRRVRAMTDKVALERGRPVLVAIKAPDSAEYARAIGLDIERWMAEDLVDLYTPGGYFQLHDWTSSIELGHKHGVKVYPSLDDVRVRDPLGNKLRTSPLAYRSRAAEAWAAGADGVYLFNHFNPRSPVWREAGDAQLLAQLDKDYLSSPRGVGKAAGGNLPYDKYRTLETLNPDNPKSLRAGKSASARLMLGDESDTTVPKRFNLRLRFKQAPEPRLLAVKLSGHPLPALTPGDDEWLEVAVPQALLKTGANQVEVTYDPAATGELSWTDLLLTVRHDRAGDTERDGD